MDSPDSYSIRVIKPNKKIKPFGFLCSVIFWMAFLVLGIYLILDAEGNIALIGLALIGCLLALLILAAELFQWVPGQGDLILTPEGFQVESLFKSLRVNYKWSEVTEFYAANLKISRLLNEERVCFDLVSSPSYRRIERLGHKYGDSPQAIADTLNQWKARYSPNQVVAELPTVQETVAAQVAKKKALDTLLFIVLGFVGLFLAYVYFFVKTDIQVINNTKAPIQNLSLVAFSTAHKETQAFDVYTLQPGQTAKIQIPHFEHDILRVEYASSRTSACTYLFREQCGWHSGDTIYLEPGKVFGAEASPCKPQKTVAEPVVLKQCPGVDVALQKQGFPPDRPTTVKPLAMPKKVGLPPYNTEMYIEAMQTTIKKHWHPPTFGKNMSATIRFQVLQDGTIKNIKLKKSSGQSEFDQLALQTVRTASPLDPLPLDIVEPSVDVEFIFEYQFRKQKHKK